jgi:hypothetical protein
LDRIVQAGRLRPFQIGTQKRGFLSSDVLKLLWESRKPPTGEPAPRKPRSPKQDRPPRRGPRPMGGAYGGKQ